MIAAHPSTKVVQPQSRLPRDIEKKVVSFAKSRWHDKWVSDSNHTHELIRALWKSAPKVQRKDPNFLILLMTLAWTNERKKRHGRDSTLIWRNRNIATYLTCASDQLVGEISNEFPDLERKAAANLLARHTGITNYHHPLRPATISVVRQKAPIVAAMFRKVASKSKPEESKIRFVVHRIASLGTIRGTSLLNGLSPVLACLDPMRQFPIINARTRPLQRLLGLQEDAEDVIAYSGLIGSPGISDSLELDACASWYSGNKQKRRWKRR